MEDRNWTSSWRQSTTSAQLRFVEKRALSKSVYSIISALNYENAMRRPDDSPGQNYTPPQSTLSVRSRLQCQNCVNVVQRLMCPVLSFVKLDIEIQKAREALHTSYGVP